MTEALPNPYELTALPPSERREMLENLILAQFRRALLMEPDEDLPLDSGFFDLGLTSLRLIEIRGSLEDQLGIGIDAAVVFSQPTIEQLVDHLTRAMAGSTTEEASR